MKLGTLQQAARREMEKHGLEGWSFRFDKGTRRFGCCNYSTKTISLSRILSESNSEEACMNTLLHEIAHALAGHAAGHGPEWVRVARSIGCDGQRCYTAATVVRVPKFTGSCPTCTKKWQRDRRARGAYCPSCYAAGKPATIKWSENVPASAVH